MIFSSWTFHPFHLSLILKSLLRLFQDSLPRKPSILLNVINCMNQYWEKKIYFGNFFHCVIVLEAMPGKQDECASREWVFEMINSLLKADLTFCLRKYFGMIVKLMISDVSRGVATWRLQKTLRRRYLWAYFAFRRICSAVSFQIYLRINIEKYLRLSRASAKLLQAASCFISKFGLKMLSKLKVFNSHLCLPLEF